jgi:hypothetical protein
MTVTRDGQRVKSQERMRMRIETITPAMATRYLGTMLRNRKVRGRHVDTLVQAITAEEWQLNGETIKFNIAGELIDGQHRLLAVIKAGKAINSYVITDIVEEGLPTIDVGLKRSPGDIFALQGYANATNLCATLRWIWRYEHGLMAGYTLSPTIQVLQDVMVAHPEAKNSLSTGSLTARFMTRSLGSALHCLFSERDATLADGFFLGIREGTDYVKDNPLYLLRQRLIANSQAKARLPDYEVAALTIKAFTCLRQGMKLRFLRWRNVGATPEEFPIIC